MHLIVKNWSILLLEIFSCLPKQYFKLLCICKLSNRSNITHMQIEKQNYTTPSINKHHFLEHQQVFTEFINFFTNFAQQPACVR